MSPDPGLQSFLLDFEKRLAPVERASGEAWWNLATTGTAEAQEEVVRAGKEYNRLFADPEEYRKVEGWHEERGDLESPLLRREVEVLYRMFAGRQGEPAILGRIEELEAEANAVYSNHRAVVGGEEIGENEVREILRSSGDESPRLEAWEASKIVGREVEGTVRELARLRNQLAREQGHENHYARALDLQEIDAGELERVMDELQSATDAPFRELKGTLDSDVREKFGVEAVMPWHLPDPFFQEAPEEEGLDADGYFAGRDLEGVTRRTYDALGLDVRGVISRSDLYERSGKDQHAFCITIGREYPYDTRVLSNTRPDAYWADTMLHEFGHAVYDRNINPKLPYLLRTVAHTCTTEAIALLMGAITAEPGWLSEVAGVSDEKLEEDQERLASRRRAEKLVFVRWALVMYRFEQALYADPGGASEDLNSVWWDLVEELQLVSRPPGRDEPDWAAKIHVALAPVYYHNYVLGHLIAAQLRSYLESHITRAPFHRNEAAGRYLQEAVFGPGARESWQDTVLRATGEPLNAEHFVRGL